MSDLKFMDKQRSGDINILADIVDDLNIEFYERTKIEWVYPFELRSVGSMHTIEFMGQNIWDSENDERLYTDEENDIKEHIETYIIRQATDLCNIMTEFFFPKGAKCWRCGAYLSRKDD